ncbi:MAG: tetratricopeptide repeat protein [Desulfobacteraceae bacterium]|nr:MAG: tetratricopeptide repeat protein [Desulfobacteraceae bacterium]
MRMKQKYSQVFAILVAIIISSGCAGPKSTPQSAGTGWSDPSRSENKYYYYTAAQFQKQNDNIDNAIFYLKMAIQNDPESTFLKKELVFIYLQQNNYEEALVFIDKLLAKNPDDIEALILKGNIRMYLNQKDEAKTVYEKILELDPKRKNVYLFLGSIYLDEEENQKALEVYRKLISHFPDSYTGYFFLGKAHERLKQYRDAEREFKKALDIEPMLVEPRYELLSIYKNEQLREDEPAATTIRKGKPHKYPNKEKITKLYHEILELYPNDIRANMELALFYHTTGDRKKAQKIFDRLADNSKTEPDIAGKIIFLFIDHKKYDDALIILNGMLKKIPDDSDINHLAGAAYDGIKDTDKALFHFKKVKDDSKFFENATIYLAYIYKNQDQPDRATEILEKAIRKMPDNPEFYFYLGYFHEDSRMYQQAESVLKKGLEITPDNPRLHFRLGVVYDKWGKKDLSIEEMKKVIGIDPQDAHALNYLGYTYLDMNMNLSEAEQLIQRAMEIEPADGYITDSLGWLYYKKGEFKEALAMLEKAISLVPDDPIILEHIGDVHMKINNREKALEFYQRALLKKEKDKESLLEKINKLSQGNE